eukprot:819721_1
MARWKGDNKHCRIGFVVLFVIVLSFTVELIGIVDLQLSSSHMSQIPLHLLSETESESKHSMTISNTSCIHNTRGTWPNITDIPSKCVLPYDYGSWGFTNDRHVAPYDDAIEFNWIINKINCLQPFAFTRWGDGEWRLMAAKTIPATQDDWSWNRSDGEMSAVGAMLNKYIDIGSSMDQMTKGFNNRPYASGRADRKSHNKCADIGRFGKDSTHHFVCKIGCK